MGPLEAELDALVAATRTAAEAPFPAAFAWITGDYRRHRLPGTDLAADGDVLLFQWGVVDWGDGLNATLDLTRQILLAAASPGGDPSIWQLHCCYRFAPPLLDRIKNGKAWCAHPDQLEPFISGMEHSPAWERLLPARPRESVVRLARL